MIDTVLGIPVAVQQPRGPAVGLALWQTHLGGSTEQTAPMLARLADAGFVAVSFDPPGHGMRGSGDPWQLASDTLAAFRQRMWPLLGRTTVEALRVIDWAQERFEVAGPVVAGGVSMGGDVAIALAGIDPRVTRVSAIVATPDWTRPDMHQLDDAAQLVDQGEADGYAQWWCDALNPMQHLQRYRRDLAIRIHDGGADHHIPVSDAQRFAAALADSPASIEVVAEPGATHLDFDDRFYDRAVEFLSA